MKCDSAVYSLLTLSQAVEHYRNLWNFVNVVTCKEPETGKSICNVSTCPRMSAGP